jgi:hypothetical protein
MDKPSPEEAAASVARIRDDDQLWSRLAAQLVELASGRPHYGRFFEELRRVLADAEVSRRAAQVSSPQDLHEREGSLAVRLIFEMHRTFCLQFPGVNVGDVLERRYRVAEVRYLSPREKVDFARFLEACLKGQIDPSSNERFIA